MDRYIGKEMKDDIEGSQQGGDNDSPTSDHPRTNIDNLGQQRQTLLSWPFPQPIRNLATAPALERLAAETRLYSQLGGGTHLPVPGLQDGRAHDDQAWLRHRIYGPIYTEGNILHPAGSDVPTMDQLLLQQHLEAAGLMQPASPAADRTRTQQSVLPDMLPPNVLDTSQSSSSTFQSETPILAEVMRRADIQFPPPAVAVARDGNQSLSFAQQQMDARKLSSLPAAATRYHGIDGVAQRPEEDRLLSLLQYPGPASRLFHPSRAAAEPQDLSEAEAYGLALLQQQQQQRNYPEAAAFPLPAASNRSEPRSSNNIVPPWLPEQAKFSGAFWNERQRRMLQASLAGGASTAMHLRDDRGDSFPLNPSYAEDERKPAPSAPRQTQEEDAPEEHVDNGDASDEEDPADASTDGTHLGVPPPVVAAAAAATVAGDEDLPIAEQIGKLPRPSRPLTAYNFFFQQERKTMIEQLPAVARGEAIEESPSRGGRVRTGIPFRVMAQAIAAKWKELSEEEKRPYEDQSLVDRRRYGKEMQVFNAQKEELMRSHHQKRFRSVEGPAWDKYCKEQSRKSKRNRR